MEGLKINNNEEDIESMLEDQQSVVSVNTENVELTNEDKEILSKLTPDDVIEFKETAVLYFDYDDQLTELNKKIREIRKQKNDCGKKLLEFMGDNKVEGVKTDIGKLKYVVTTQKERMNNKYIKKKLLSYFNSDEKALECFKHLDNRDKIEVPKLKRTKN
jgi:hypothetical protein